MKSITKRNFDVGGKDLTDFGILRETIPESNFNDTTIFNATFSETNLQDSYFNNALIVKTSFVNTRLSNSSFKNMVCQSVDFSNSNLSSVDFTNSTLIDIKISKKADLSNVKLHNVTIDEKSVDQLPNALVRVYSSVWNEISDYEIQQKIEEINDKLRKAKIEVSEENLNASFLSIGHPSYVYHKAYSVLIAEKHKNDDFENRIKELEKFQSKNQNSIIVFKNEIRILGGKVDDLNDKVYSIKEEIKRIKFALVHLIKNSTLKVKKSEKDSWIKIVNTIDTTPDGHINLRDFKKQLNEISKNSVIRLLKTISVHGINNIFFAIVFEILKKYAGF